jgi:uncharacterized protein (TIGR00369 family)
MSGIFEPRDPDYISKVEASFAAQAAMQTVGASLKSVAPGQVEIEMPYRVENTQQNGFVHAGIASTIMDSACGYAAYSLMPAGASVLTIEYKINLLSPAEGDSFVAIGRVRKVGRTVTVAEADLIATLNGHEKLVATMTGTLMAIYPKEEE